MEKRVINAGEENKTTGVTQGSKLYSLQFGATSQELLEASLLVLAEENKAYLQSLVDHTGCFKKTKLIEYVFLLCEHFGLEKSTKFQAAELIERFMIRYIHHLYKSVSQPHKDEGNGNKDSWGSLQIQLLDHFELRIVTCVQLSSKLGFHCCIISNSVAVKFLQSLGYLYSKDDLLASEILVLKIMDFQVNVRNPFTYVETLLEVLGFNEPAIPVINLHSIGHEVLQCVYLLRSSIYDSLLKAVIENSTPSKLQREKFLTVKEDMLLLAVAVIAVSAFILNYTPWNQILEHLSSITGITTDNISVFSQLILKHITGTGT